MFSCFRKIVSWALIMGLVISGFGLVTYGTSFGSYVRSSIGIVKDKAKESVPIEFEIQRARDLLEDLIPEMRANLRLVATEEVDVVNLQREIEQQAEAVEKERGKLQSLRSKLGSGEISYAISGRTYQRTELVGLLSTQLDRLTTAEKFLAGKKELLTTRTASLSAAMKNVERTRLARVELESKIEALEEQFRLMQLKASSSSFHVNNSKLAQVEKAIGDLQKRLDVAQKVMAAEAQFLDIVPLDDPEIDEESIIERVDSYFGRSRASPRGDNDVSTAHRSF